MRPSQDGAEPETAAVHTTEVSGKTKKQVLSEASLNKISSCNSLIKKATLLIAKYHS